MLNLLRAVPLVVLAACVSTTPRSLTQVKYYFDCDVPPGKSSEWNRTVNGNEVRVSGFLQLIEPRRDPTWGPVANVSITGADDTSSVGLGAGIDWHAPDILIVAPVALTGPVLSQVLVSKAWSGLPIPFEVSFKSSGELKVSAAGQLRILQIQRFDMRKVTLSCSTSHFKFTDVSVEVDR
jgi:hypothetical protein